MNRNRFIILFNAVIMLIIAAFVFKYTNDDARARTESQINDFENITVAMEQVTTNYMEGEQRICDVWAHFINNRSMSMKDAVDFIRVSHVDSEASAHVIYLDDGSLEGFSTRPRTGTMADYAVSYASPELSALIDELEGDMKNGSDINVTRVYTNPMNGVQSLAFCNEIRLSDGGTQSRKALLMRLIPLSVLEDKWVFPREEYASAEVSIIDSGGNFIISGASFTETNFYDAFRSHNKTDSGTLRELEKELHAASGSLSMTSSDGRECLIAHAPLRSAGDWTILNLIPIGDIAGEAANLTLIYIVAGGLLLLLLFDAAYMSGLNRKLRQTAEEADRANHAKTEFLSTMSHDIRTPMNAIIGLTTIAEKNVEDSESVKDNLHKISLASNHLLTLINDILDISKVESGKLNLTPLSFSIVETADNLVNISQPMVKEKNIDFSFRINRMDTEYLYADQLRLNQIFINILSNAIKYTEPGGKVSVDMMEVPSTQAGKVGLVYRVKDNGIGMSKEFMEVMYEPFSRETDSRVNSVRGTGLGLAITKQMVDLMGGSIDCESESGKGTTFTIRLDLPAADKQLEEMDLGPVSVFIADDDEILLETAKDALSSLGAKVESAQDAQEALDTICARHRDGKDYDVIIVDWKMPGMNGIDVIRKIRDEAGIEVPILLISAYDWSDIEDAAKEAGANGFISKPLFRSKLYNTLSSLLGVKSSITEPEEDNSDIVGMKILVAEDNDINWEIIEALLDMYGIKAVRAENGQVAVDMVKAATGAMYDLVFMDIQMPVMNGLIATETIRKLPEPDAAAVPIIAMTADAFSENVAACLAAGMDGHIAKPVDINIVLKEMRRIKESKQKGERNA